MTTTTAAVATKNLLGYLFGLEPIQRAGELAIIESQIQHIITVIQNEVGEVKPEHFRTGAFISATAFGSGAKADELALHHTKAHSVMADTLVGVTKDLEDYITACQAARTYLSEADLTAAGDLKALQNAVGALAIGAASDHGDTAFHQSQVDHRNDTAVRGGEGR